MFILSRQRQFNSVVADATRISLNLVRAINYTAKVIISLRDKETNLLRVYFFKDHQLVTIEKKSKVIRGQENKY